MTIGYDANGIYVIGQQEYQNIVNNWQATGNSSNLQGFLWDMLTQGGRAIAGANNKGYSSYPEIVANLMSKGIDVTHWGLPTVQQVQANAHAYPGLTPGPMYPQAIPGPTPPKPASTQAAAPAGHPTTGTVTVNPDQVTAFRSVKRFLDEIGFGNMATLDSKGNPGGWLWDQVVKKGYTTQDEIMSALDANAAWHKRFQVHYDQMAQVGKGIPTQVMSFAEIRQYEKSAADVMRAYGMPTQLYDNYTDFQNLMRRGVSIDSLNKAVSVSWNRVANAGANVKQAFTDLYGPAGNSMLASWFLDNAQYEQKLDLMSRAASIKGTAGALGLDIGRSVSESLGQAGYEGTTARTQLADLAAKSQLLSEDISDTTDLTANQAVSGTFGLNAEDQAALQARSQRRGAQLAGGGGGMLNETGVLSHREAI